MKQPFRTNKLRFFCSVIILFSLSTFVVLAEQVTQEQQTADRFWEILVKSPRRGTTFDRVYAYYVDTGHAEQLLQYCQNLTEENPKYAKAWMLYGLTAERRGLIEDAANAFQNATQLDSKDTVAPFYLGELRMVQGRLSEAIDALEIAAQRQPTRTEIRAVLQTLGRAYERFGEPQKSAAVWNKLEQLFPEDPEMLVQIAELLESENRFDEALKRYEKLIATAGDEFSRVRYVLALVDIKLKQGNEQDALENLNKLLDHLAPESWLAESVRDRIERIFIRNNDITGLVEFYRARLEKHSTDFEAVRRLALAMRQLGQLDDARQLLSTTIEKTPSHIPLRLTLIDFLIDLKEIAAAVEQYQVIDQLSPNNSDYLTRWGQLVLQNENVNEESRQAEAVKIWSRITDADPTNPVAAVTTADLLLRNKIYNEAEQFYQKAMALRPNDTAYREYLALFYHSRRQKEKGLETLRPLGEGDKQTIDNLAQLGNLLQSLGYASESFQTFQRAAALFADDWQTQWRYIEAMIRRGTPPDMEEAAQRLTQAERLVETEEQFEAFLQQEVQFLKSTQKLAETTATLEKQIEEIQNNKESVSLVRAFWRLAVYRQAEVKIQAAVTAIEKALDVEPSPSNRLRRVAAELFEQNGDGEKALEAYQILAEEDTVRRVDHLKHLISLQIKLGQIDNAIETGRRLIGLGSGNPAYLRFYADLLLSVGRREEGMEILRQALRMEPGDVTTLALLAQTLAQDGKGNEAIEITWRLFERTDNLSGQLSIINTLTD
ncbi:MAG: tetratricopeptide repeat protein, partial [Planctomycetaceae bacterium]|nr:tetratricopeptide repeat protein [Planctomycetaceae bacterium]